MLNINTLREQVLSALPGDVVAMMQASPPESVCVAGGFIRAVLEGSTPRDVDIFVREGIDPRIVAEKLAGEFVSIWKSDHAFTLRRKGSVLQIVNAERYIYKHPIGLLYEFDFSVCQFALFLNVNRGFTVITADNTLIDVEEKRLRFVGKPCDAHRSLLRAFKYHRYGYVPTAQTLCQIIGNIAAQGISVDKFNESDIS